jgi:chaperone modulatory protein CbpM
MRDDEVLTGSFMEETWLTLEQVAACAVEPQWLAHIEAGEFPHAASAAGVWRFSSACLLRARRLHQIECDFDAAPEQAALVADMPEEMDALRARQRRAGQA